MQLLVTSEMPPTHSVHGSGAKSGYEARVSEVLETPRLILRRFRPEDWQDLKEYVLRPEVLEFEPPYPTTDEGIQEMAAWLAESPDFWAVTLRESGKVVGQIHNGLRDQPAWNCRNLGYVMNPEWWGRGLATEAAARVMRHAFEELDCRRIYSGCNPKNIASWRVLEKLGMRREAHHIKGVAFHQDESGRLIFNDSYGYAILKEEWLERQAGGHVT